MSLRQKPWALREIKRPRVINSWFKINANEERKDNNRWKISRNTAMWNYIDFKTINKGFAIERLGVVAGPEKSIVDKGEIQEHALIIIK